MTMQNQFQYSVPPRPPQIVRPCDIPALMSYSCLKFQKYYKCSYSIHYIYLRFILLTWKPKHPFCLNKPLKCCMTKKMKKKNWIFHIFWSTYYVCILNTMYLSTWAFKIQTDGLCASLTNILLPISIFQA